MKKYYPVDFDEKGNAVLGNAKNTPTSNGFIPTTWAPGGGEDDKQGIKSITISPAITTTPALDSLFPIYWDDLTEEQRQDGVTLSLTTDAGLTVDAEYQFTITPTTDMYIIADEPGGKGEPVAVTGHVVEIDGKRGIRLTEFYVVSTLEQPTEEVMAFSFKLNIINPNPQ